MYYFLNRVVLFKLNMAEASMMNSVPPVNNNNNYSFNEHHFPKRPALDLSFSDIKYTVTSWSNRTRGEWPASTPLYACQRKLGYMSLPVRISSGFVCVRIYSIWEGLVVAFV